MVAALRQPAGTQGPVLFHEGGNGVSGIALNALTDVLECEYPYSFPLFYYLRACHTCWVSNILA